jgi:hypothetical protein
VSRIRKNVANCWTPSRRQQSVLMFDMMSAAEVTHVICVRSEACSIAVSSAAGHALALDVGDRQQERVAAGTTS